MKKALLIILSIGLFNSAFAKDSAWLICIGDVNLNNSTVKVAVNIYEHRNGEGRVTELTMINGGNTLKGSFNNTESDESSVTLKEKKSNYKGLVKVDYSSSSLDLSGQINLSGSISPVATTLKCERLD